MKVYSLMSHWNNGDNFEESIVVKVFKSMSSAMEYLEVEMDEVRECFKSAGLKPYLHKDEMQTDSHFVSRLISNGLNSFDDWWECEISEQEVE